MKRIWIWSVLFVVLVALVLGLTFGLRQMKDQQDEPPSVEGSAGETEIDWLN
jgi:hypothetical protein